MLWKNTNTGPKEIRAIVRNGISIDLRNHPAREAILRPLRETLTYLPPHHGDIFKLGTRAKMRVSH